jgi:hypothetical protein
LEGLPIIGRNFQRIRFGLDSTTLRRDSIKAEVPLVGNPMPR